MLKTCNFTKMDIIISQHCRPGILDCTEPDTSPKFNRSESNRSPLKSDGWKTIVSNGLFSVVFAVTFHDLGSVSNQGSSLRAGSPSYLASKSRALKGAFVAPWKNKQWWHNNKRSLAIWREIWLGGNSYRNSHTSGDWEWYGSSVEAWGFYC